MGGAELAPADKFHIGILLAQLRFESGEDFVAREQIVPELGNGFSLERIQSPGERPHFLLSLPGRPNHFIGAIAARFLRHRKLLQCKSRRATASAAPTPSAIASITFPP